VSEFLAAAPFGVDAAFVSVELGALPKVEWFTSSSVYTRLGLALSFFFCSRALRAASATGSPVDCWEGSCALAEDGNAVKMKAAVAKLTTAKQFRQVRVFINWPPGSKKALRRN
jgi:hypothetical protein